MLSRSLTLNADEVRGRGHGTQAPPPGLSSDEEEPACSGVPRPPAPPWSASSSPASSSLPASSVLSAPSTAPPFVSLSCSSSSSSHLVPGSLHPFFPPTPPSHPSFTSLLLPPVSAPPPPPRVSFTSYSMTNSLPLVPSPLSPSIAPHPPPLPLPPPPPPPPPPCCSCSSVLPRLLSAHRLEVRRLLRGALASLGRRLDSLERSSRRKRRRKVKRRQRGGTAPPGLPAFGSAPVPPSCTSSSSDSEESQAPPASSCRQTESSRRIIKEAKSRRRCHREADVRDRGKEAKEEEEEEEEEEEGGRFVGRMAFSYGGRAQEEEPLTLHNLTQSKRRRKEVADTVVMVKNGYKTPKLGSTSQHALHILPSAQSGWADSQSEAFTVSTGQWCFPDPTPPIPFCSKYTVLHLWLCSASTLSSAPMLRLSPVGVEKVLEPMKGGVCWDPQRPLKDWTAPPSLGIDHCYIRAAFLSPVLSARRQQRPRANHGARALRPLRRRALPACLANGLLAPLPVVEASSQFPCNNGERGKRVSQIRIRRASPRETLLTPMGLPKVKRLKKKEFSLEEIYTNKNYKSPSTNRSLETIFEEPREKDGSLLLIGQQKRRRILLFPDFTQPRKRKKLQGAGLAVAMVPRKRAAARRHVHGSDDDSDLDVMLVERLSALEDFLLRQGLET